VNDLPEPQLDGESMIVQVEATAANFADRLVIDGKHQIRPVRPFTAGLEVAGTVVDSSSERHPVGSRVMGLVEPGVGSWAERCRCSPRNVIRIPDGVEWIKDAATGFNPDGNAVNVASGATVTYDVLVVCPQRWGRLSAAPPSPLFIRFELWLGVSGGLWTRCVRAVVGHGYLLRVGAV